ncbi:DUF1761 domain-containing protein [Sphingomonas sp. G-3-2-10]|uniref:DUF1761 domain-containing protein n=1 Tax=Sphingomonas sp. G-3-2-10 TaxID=2728838 RepID=UPI00146BC40A|nr:DUF1761 domain-containing protein [Sphingomonas sp. G-3-2-10]NML04766.1 DUF1761 domain-containing protein [Sphingomonas sp. G-3-2-10]
MHQAINWLAVLVAGFAGFAVGGVWYGPLFAKAWMKERGITMDAAKKVNMPLIYGTAFVLNLVMAFMLVHILGGFHPGSVGHWVIASAVIALGFVVPAMGVNYLFSGLSRKLFAIDAGYWIVNFCAMGLIIGLLI